MMNDVILPAIRDAITNAKIVLYHRRPTTPLDNLTQGDKKRCVHMLDTDCRSDIELFCYRTGPEYIAGIGTIGWLDISNTPECPVQKQVVDDAIWWCEMRGLFIRHPEHKHLVRFKTIAREQYAVDAT